MGIQFAVCFEVTLYTFHNARLLHKYRVSVYIGNTLISIVHSRAGMYT